MSDSMRLIVARCSVEYSGRLSARLPEALRLVIVKADGSVLVHADAGGYKPLNWMTPPTAHRGGRDTIVVRKLTGEDQLEITLDEIDLRRLDRMGSTPIGSTRTASRRTSRARWRRRPAGLRRGVPARPPLADGHRPGRPCAATTTAGSPSRSSASARSTRSSNSRVTWSASGGTRRPPRCRGVLAAQTIKPQARVLAEARGIAWIEIDLATLRGSASPRSPYSPDRVTISERAPPWSRCSHR